MSLIMICGLLNLAVDTRGIQVSWVDHPSSAPGGSFAYQVLTYTRTAIASLGYVTVMLIELLTNGTQIWRLSIMWRVSRYHLFIIMIPSLALLGSIVIEIVEICNIISGRPISTDSQWPVIAAVRQGMMMFTGLIVTSLISARIALVRRTHIQTMGESDISNQYFSIISMLVESFALEFIWSTMIITTNFWPDNVRASAVNDVFINLQSSIEIITYLLVVYRVSTRRAWEKDTEEKLTSLRWNRDAQRTTQLTTTQTSIRISGDAPGDEV
ncbi:hypothetical protein NP233_g11037 [Leucocoprinus birnbaumii]|uniref:Uncharacterized protein n=1 Tax=Leucocoprinus birnbaumii TaxID=56174 RepID=A0AAD5VI47_9AGAR|nr:hypothetical protein NP233_g11037 [Leucocoprinus birnbaumii]